MVAGTPDGKSHIIPPSKFAWRINARDWKSEHTESESHDVKFEKTQYMVKVRWLPYLSRWCVVPRMAGKRVKCHREVLYCLNFRHRNGNKDSDPAHKSCESACDSGCLPLNQLAAPALDAGPATHPGAILAAELGRHHTSTSINQTLITPGQ